VEAELAVLYFGVIISPRIEVVRIDLETTVDLNVFHSWIK
jgi:hypothetical protein